MYDEERPTILLYNFKNMHFESIIRLSKDQSVQTKHFTSENITHESKMFNPNNNAINKLSIKYRSKCLKISNMFLRNWRNSDIYKCKTDIYTAVDGWELPDNRGFCPINKRYLHKITRVEDDDDTPDTCCHSTIDITDSGKENVLELSKKSMPKAQSKTQSKADIERLSVLEQLKIMGFNDSSLNNQLYDTYKGNITLIINHLVKSKTPETEEDTESEEDSESEQDSEEVSEEDSEQDSEEDSEEDENITNPEFDDYAKEDYVDNTITLSSIRFNIPINNKIEAITFYRGNNLLSGKYKNRKSLYYRFEDNEDLTRVGVYDDNTNEIIFFNNNLKQITNDYLKKN